MHRRTIDPKVSVSIVFVAAMFMSIMDSTVVNVALPSIAKDLHASNASIDAIVVGYLVSLAVVIPASGWLGDRFGTKRIFLAALALFSIDSALCGLAGNLTLLVLFRILQGAAGGAMTPVGNAILYRTFPPEQRVQVSRILIIPTVIAPATGPVLGGFLVDQFSWSWVFYINVPIGIAACLFGLFFLYEHKEQSAGKFDVTGFVLAGAGLALLMYALSEGPSHGWLASDILICGVVGIAVLVAFVVLELRTKEPMIDLRLLSNRIFRTCNLIALFSSAGFLGVLFIGPLYLQEGRGVSALMSGLTTFPEAIGVVLSTQIVARLYPHIGPRRLMAGGLLGVTVTMSLLSLMGSDTTLWLMRILMFLTGAGMAYSFLPVQAAAFSTISSSDTGRASALYNAQRQLGAAFGVAILSSVLNAVGPFKMGANNALIPNMTAYHAAFFAAAGLALIGSLIALTVIDKDAESTMKRVTRKGERDEGVGQVEGVEAGV